MKKILMALALCLILVGVMSVPAMAAKPPTSPTTNSPPYEEVYMNYIIEGVVTYIDCGYTDYDNPTQLVLDVEIYSEYTGLDIANYHGDISPSALNINYIKGTATLNTTIATDDPGWYGNVPTNTSVDLTWTFNPRQVESYTSIDRNFAGQIWDPVSEEWVSDLITAQIGINKGIDASSFTPITLVSGSTLFDQSYSTNVDITGDNSAWGYIESGTATTIVKNKP